MVSNCLYTVKQFLLAFTAVLYTVMVLPRWLSGYGARLLTRKTREWHEIQEVILSTDENETGSFRATVASLLEIPQHLPKGDYFLPGSGSLS
ncbi:hypothetical protein V5799_008734 [Amblyomma americanum]|uniref:Uncharacterized protein n=1 Tax=Amblyomma americanum TaxID=6943 RepID=A0AAQ4FDT9_AMBAM